MEALVTGANRGIGLELVRQLAARGDRVTAACRHPDSAEELRSLRVEVVALDVNDGNAVGDLARRTAGQPLDLLINNAGVGVGVSRLGAIDYQQIELFFKTNAVAPLRLAEAMLPRLRLGSRRLLVNMTSRMGSIEDNTGGGAYAYRASKAALNMITKSLAIDLADEDIRVVAIHPGWVQTDMGGASARTTVVESVRGILRVLDDLDSDQSGGFFDFSGEKIPW